MNFLFFFPCLLFSNCAMILRLMTIFVLVAQIFLISTLLWNFRLLLLIGIGTWIWFFQFLSLSSELFVMEFINFVFFLSQGFLELLPICYVFTLFIYIKKTLLPLVFNYIIVWFFKLLMLNKEFHWLFCYSFLLFFDVTLWWMW